MISSCVQLAAVAAVLRRLRRIHTEPPQPVETACAAVLVRRFCGGCGGSPQLIEIVGAAVLRRLCGGIPPHPPTRGRAREGARRWGSPSLRCMRRGG